MKKTAMTSGWSNESGYLQRTSAQNYLHGGSLTQVMSSSCGSGDISSSCGSGDLSSSCGSGE